MNSLYKHNKSKLVDLEKHNNQNELIVIGKGVGGWFSNEEKI